MGQFRETKLKIERVVEKYPKHFYWKIKKKFPDTFEAVNSNYEKIDSFSEKLYRYLYGKNSSVCNLNGCNGSCYFRSFSDGYRSYCSRSCAYESQKNRETRNCIICEEEFEVKKSRSKKLCSRECWENWNKLENVQNQAVTSRRETCRKKYGKDHFVNPEKMKETKLERHGSPGYNNAKQGVKTKRKKYGDGLEGIFEKVKKTKKKRYGDPHYCNSSKIKEKSLRRSYDLLCSDKGRFASANPLFSFDEYKGRYDGGPVYYKFECNGCGEIFEGSPHSQINPRCPNCYPIKRSVGEQELSDFIKSVCSENTLVRENVNDVIDSGELDVYIPEKNLAVEYDGLYWHGELNGRDRKYHLQKTIECEKQGIHLIHVFENEWTDKGDVVRRRLKHVFGENGGDVVYARDCNVKEVDASSKNEFLNNHHLQGQDRSSIKIGLFYEDEMVSVMTFSGRRIALGGSPTENEGEYELSRFCSSEKRVVGGAGKLFTYFIRTYNPNKIVTYADRRWTMNNGKTIYDKIGFDFDSKTRPNYWYFKSGVDLKHRFNFRKSVLSEKLGEFDPDLSEWENMKINGYDRIWDCGHLKYEWKNDH